MKFSHISDTHLGFTQLGLDEREKDIYDAFDQTIDQSITDKVEFVLFTGDIFHVPNPRGKAQIKFANALKRLKDNNISSYFVLGEHDISNIKDTPVSFIPHKLGFTNYLENGKPFFHKNVLIIGFDKFRKNEAEFFKGKLKEAYNEAEKHNGPKILVMHQGIIEINQYAGELNSTELPSNFDYYAMGHLHDKTVVRYDHLNGPVVYPGSIEHTDSQGIGEKEKGFYEGEITESKITESWQPLKIRPQISSTIDIEKIEDEIAKVSDMITSLDAKPIVEIKIKGKDVDLDLIDVKIAELRKNCLFLRIKSVDEDLEGHHIFSDRPSIDKEVTSLAKKYLEDEELAEFATKELLPALEKNEIEMANEIVMKNFKQFRSKKDA